jgi:hypothetical protein
MEHLSHDNTEMEDEHFAEVLAAALIRSSIVPNGDLCERWLREGYVDENELEAVLEAYEEFMEI